MLTYLLIAALVFSTIWQALAMRGMTFSRSALGWPRAGGRARGGTPRAGEPLAVPQALGAGARWLDAAGPPRGLCLQRWPAPAHRLARAHALPRRGRYTLGPVTATTGDPLGLFRRELTLAPEHQLLVLPPVLPLARFELYPGAMPGRGRGSQRSLQTTTNVVTVRNYVPGDALTRIHWPSTARLGQFMVKEFDLDPTIDVVSCSIWTARRRRAKAIARPRNMA